MTMPGVPVSKREMLETLSAEAMEAAAAPENQPPAAVVDQIVNTINADPSTPMVEPEMVYQIMAAWNAAHYGEELNTVRRDPQTGSIAVRVAENNVHLWRVTSPDGAVSRDMRPALPDWEKLTP